MARLFIRDMDWVAIQKLYDSGCSTREVGAQFGITANTMNKATKIGLFKTRSGSESKKMQLALKPRTYAKQRAERSALVNYRADCQFKFSLWDYPDKFDFSLLETYGWYSAKNRGNNTNGVSRDHAVSIRYGFDNNIHPSIMSHPANCCLMQQRKNAAKSLQCSMTLGELFARIEIFSAG